MGILSNIVRAASSFSDGIVSSAEEFAKARRDLPVPKATGDGEAESPTAMAWDPFSIIESMGYKDKPSSITYGTLAAMVWKTPLVQNIIVTRLNQLANFSTRQQDKFETGYRVRLEDKSVKMTPADQKRAGELERMLQNTGVIKDSALERCSFETFLRAFGRDSLTYDQGCFEVTRNRKGRPAAFYAVDASTIRLADTTSISHTYDPSAIHTVQIYDNMVINQWTKERMAFCIRNPHTSVRLAGYGVSELEMLINAITAILWAFEYNQRFFCVTADTKVTTDLGLQEIRDLSGTEFRVWTGREWKAARAFKTGLRPVVRTKLWNGLELRTSPEHRFRVLRDSMSPVWVEQANLQPGDTLLVDTSRVDPPLNEDTLLVGKTYETDRTSGHDFTPSSEMVKDLEFWEMVGFMLGDGYWPSPSDRPCVLSIFPHYEKDLPLFDRFLAVLKRYGINGEKVTINKTVKRADGEYGYPAIHIHHRAFVEWLHELGFTGSTSGKRIAPILFAQPAFIRDALLRGLFSADGHTRKHVTGYKTPSVYAEDPVFRQDILQCLFSVGVASQNVGRGWARDGTIDVQNIEAFVKHVGFLQPYKNEGITRSPKSSGRWDRLRPSYSRQIAGALLDHAGGATQFSSSEKGYLKKAFSGEFVMSRGRVLRLLAKAGLEPKPALFYHHVPVDIVEVSTDRQEEMYDVEVFDDEHLFLANGVAVHNSQGSVAKGVLSIKGTMNQAQLRAFRRHWYQMISGVENAWRSPVINSSEGVEWVDMHPSNRDMEFSAWMDFLIKMIASCYQMDPMEVGFKYGDSGSGKSMFESGNKEKLTASKDKGLKPFVSFVFHELSRYVVSPAEPGFIVEAVGLERETKEELAKINEIKVRTTHTLNEVRAEQDLEPIDGGDIPLNPVFVQHMNNLEQQKMQKESMSMQQDGMLMDAVGQIGSGEELSDPDAEDESFSEDDFANLQDRTQGSESPAGKPSFKKSTKRPVVLEMEI